MDSNLYRASLAVPNQNAWARVARECTRMLEGDQWDEAVRRSREQARLPVLTINKIRPLVRLVYGWFVQNKIGVTYRAGNDSVSTPEAADILTKLFANAAALNHFAFSQGDVFLDGLTTGRGWLDIRADFSRNFLGEIVIRSKNPFYVYPDPEAEEYDPAEWAYSTETRWMSLDDILVYYGVASRSKVKDQIRSSAGRHRYSDLPWYGSEVSPDVGFGLNQCFERAEDKAWWRSGDGANAVDLVDPHRRLIRVIDCQWRTLERARQFVDLVTGETRRIPDSWERERIAAALMWSEEMGRVTGNGQTLAVREGPVPVWRWTVTAGDQLLHDSVSPYEAPTQILYSPYFRRGRTQGMIDDLLDPQREINKRRSAFAQIIAQSANGGWMVPKGSLQPVEVEQLKEQGSTPGVVMEYDVIGGQRPEPIVPAQMPQAYAVLEQAASQDLRDISNINEAVLGTFEGVESGAALVARQRGAATSIQSYLDPFQRTMTLLGQRFRQIVGAIYTEERTFREQGDGAASNDPYVINRRLADGRIANDVTSGGFQTVVQASPLTAVAADAEFEKMLAIRDKGIPIGDRFIIDSANLAKRREIIDDNARQQQLAEAAAGLAPGGPPQGGAGPRPLPAGGAGAGRPPTLPAAA